MEAGGRILTSMEVSMEAVEVSKEVGGSRLTYMEVGESFHGGAWKLPQSVEVEASVSSINCSFHEHSPWKLP